MHYFDYDRISSCRRLHTTHQTTHTSHYHLRLALIASVFLVFCSALTAQDFLSAFRAGGVENTDRSQGIVVSSGNVIITGSFEGTAMFGGTPFTAVGSDDTGLTDFFVAKFNDDGSLLWLRHTGGVRIAGMQTGTNLGQAVTTDQSNNVIFTGSYIGNPTLSGTAMPVGGTNEDFFLVKYDANGTLVWIRTGLGSFQVFGFGVATDNTENIYATGTPIRSTRPNSLPTDITHTIQGLTLLSYYSWTAS